MSCVVLYINSINNNVFKTRLVIELKNLSVYGSLVGPVVESRPNQ